MVGKKKDILNFLLVLAALIGANIVVQYKFFRVDFTSDKRYSISESTVAVIKELDQNVYVKVYLHGQFPAKFKKLEEAVEETLEEFRAYNMGIKYEFFDPNAAPNDSLRRVQFMEAMQQGVQPIALRDKDGANSSETYVFPGAVLEYKGRKTAVNFMKGAEMIAPEERIAQSISELEYEFASAIKTLAQEERKRIAFLEGHGEIAVNVIQDLVMELGKLYEVGMLNLTSIPKITEIDVIVVAQPTQTFSEADKAKLDQYILNGGKVLFCMDALEVRRDSVGMQALPYEHNLTDFFFNYGIRINQNMVQDLTAAPVRVNTGSQYKLLPWAFHPLVSRFSNHVITKGFEGSAVYMRYISTLDTIETETKITKTPLMFTSDYCRVKNQPVVYSADELRINLDRKFYTNGSMPVAFLLEGEFKSLFKGRNLPQGVDRKDRKNEGSGAIVVVSDGDVLLPEIQEKTGRAYPLGFHPLLGQTFINKTFVKNTIDYLVGENSITDLRYKVLDFRPLDKFKVKEEKLKWQLINMVLPVLLVVVFGVIRFVVRKKKYASF